MNASRADFHSQVGQAGNVEPEISEIERTAEGGAGIWPELNAHGDWIGRHERELRPGCGLACIRRTKAVVKKFGQLDRAIAQRDGEGVRGVDESSGESFHGKVKVGGADHRGQRMIPRQESRRAAGAK